MLAVGWEDREATPAELDRMRRLVAEGMEQGAVGMSSGLTYTPGMYAKDAELTELCRVVASYGGYYCPHHRSYGAGALEAYEEMVALAREAGCPLHLAHATMNFGVNKDRAPELLSLLDSALATGADITLDTYPTHRARRRWPRCCPAGRARRSGEDPRTARRRRGDRADPARHGGPRLRRLPRRAHRVGHDRDLGGATRGSRRTSAEPSRSRRTCAGRTRGRRRPAACWSRTGSAPRSCSTWATRRTCGRSCGTGSTPAARTASSRAQNRTRERTAPSRTISAGT